VLLYLASKKGFPITGTLLPKIDWDRVESVATWEDYCNFEYVVEWEDKE
jgi:hypothetical protein